MTWIAAAIVGGSVVTGMLGANAARGAAQTQADAANQATAAQTAMYNQTTANVAPWLDAGKSSLADLSKGMQDGAFTPSKYAPLTLDKFHQDPGYQFQLQQGLDALTNKASMAGGINSNNLKGLIGYAEGLASTDYQQAFNNETTLTGLNNQNQQQQYSNLATLSQMGLGAGLQQGQIGANVGQAIGSNIMGAGNARAAGQIGSANAITGAMGGGYNAWLQSQYLDQSQNPYSSMGIKGNDGTGYYYADQSAVGPF